MREDRDGGGVVKQHRAAQSILLRRGFVCHHALANRRHPAPATRPRRHEPRSGRRASPAACRAGASPRRRGSPRAAPGRRRLRSRRSRWAVPSWPGTFLDLRLVGDSCRASLEDRLRVRPRQLRWPELEGELVDGSREAERRVELSSTPVRVSTPMSNVSSMVIMSGIECSIFLEPVPCHPP